MNFFDVLAAEKWGGGTPTINFFDLLFAQSMGGGEQWETYEGTLPATINANGDNMKQYQVYGNTGGVGDRTDNIYNNAETTWSVDNTLLDDNGNPVASSSHYTTNFTIVNSESNYYLSGTYRMVSTISSVRIYFYDESKDWISRSTQINIGVIRTFMTPANCKFIQIQVDNGVLSTADWYIKEGTTPPETYVPYGYKLDMGVKSGNLLSFDALMNAPSGALSNYSFPHVLNLTLKPYTKYTAVSDGAGSESGTSDSNRSVYINDSAAQTCVFSEHPVTVQTDADGVIKIGIQSEKQNAQQYINGTAHVWLVEGALPLPYQPYSNTTTPIYIGSDPLEKDEYVDYQAQKVYRMIEGTLIPTDPPVPLPALPTCYGETIVDYAGSGTAPEKVYFEYKGGTQS